MMDAANTDRMRMASMARIKATPPSDSFRVAEVSIEKTSLPRLRDPPRRYLRQRQVWRPRLQAARRRDVGALQPGPDGSGRQIPKGLGPRSIDLGMGVYLRR